MDFFYIYFKGNWKYMTDSDSMKAMDKTVNFEKIGVCKNVKIVLARVIFKQIRIPSFI